MIYIYYLKSKKTALFCDQSQISEAWRSFSQCLKTVFPADKRPGEHLVAACKAIPMIDLNDVDKNDVIHLIMNACRDYGFFQLLVHLSTEVRKLDSRILEMICQGLGLEKGFFFKDGLSEDMFLTVNHYPPCPDPSLTLGLAKHCDPNLITILMQGDVPGLQVFKDGEWISVQPLKHAFVINVSYFLHAILLDY
ncbi:Hyoscyamine 6-dioxygenase-like protein [Drosera capensis]